MMGSSYIYTSGVGGGGGVPWELLITIESSISSGADIFEFIMSDI